MKKTILFASAFFAMLLTTNLSAQVTSGGDGSTTSGDQRDPNDAMKCCPSIYVETPSVKKGGKASRRLLSGNPFKGKNRGIDLSYDIVDAGGSPVANGESAVTKDAAGNLVIDRSKLSKAGKFRLRLKAGTATEFLNF